MAAEAKAQTELQDFKSLFSLEGKVVVVVCTILHFLPPPAFPSLCNKKIPLSGFQDIHWAQRVFDVLP